MSPRWPERVVRPGRWALTSHYLNERFTTADSFAGPDPAIAAKPKRNRHMSIVITPNVPVVAAQGVTAGVVLQAGSVVSAQVLQVLGNDQVQIAIGGQSIDVLSQVPLQPGQALQLAVSQTSDGIRLAIVNADGSALASQGLANLAGGAATLDFLTLAPEAIASIAPQTSSGIVAAKNPLTPQETLAVSAAAQTAAAQQTSLAPLFANLDAASGLDGLPPQVRRRWRSCWRNAPASIQTLPAATSSRRSRIPACSWRPHWRRDRLRRRPPHRISRPR